MTKKCQNFWLNVDKRVVLPNMKNSTLKYGYLSVLSVCLSQCVSPSQCGCLSQGVCLSHMCVFLSVCVCLSVSLSVRG